MRRGLLTHECTGELIESVVAANVLPHCYQAAGRIPKAGGVYRTSLLVQRLLRKERVYPVMI